MATNFIVRNAGVMKQFIMMKRILVAVCALFVGSAALVASPVTFADSTLSDDFNDNRTDVSRFINWGLGGPEAVEVNGRVEVTIPASSTGEIFGAGYVSACALTGDFDLQIEYQLLQWPVQNGVRVSLYTGPNPWNEAVERISWGTSDPSFSFDPTTPEVYLMYANRAVVPTSDTFGKLRLQRVNGVATAYYFTSGQWAQINTGSVPTDDIHFYFAAYSHDAPGMFGRQQVRVGFDNLIVQGTLNCSKRWSKGNHGPLL